MDILKDFISQYGATMLYAMLTALAGYLGIVLKKRVDRYLDTKEKRLIAKTCVSAVEQIYRDLHGEEKLNKALESFSEMLAEKGIKISELEMRMLLEAAVSEFNDAFNRKGEGESGEKAEPEKPADARE